MTDPKTNPQATGLLATDTGDNLSERAGYYDESKSGSVGTLQDQEVYSPSATPSDTLDSDGSGTTFDAGSAIPGK